MTVSLGVPPFFHPATTGRSRARLYVLGSVVCVAVYLVASVAAVIVLVGLGMLAGRTADEVTAAMQPPMSFDALGIGAAAGLLVTLLPSLALLAVVLLLVRYLHRRPWRGVITAHGSVRMRRTLAGGLLFLFLVVIVELGAYLSAPDLYRWAFEPWALMSVAPVALLLVPLQTSAEEIFFRGYLMQRLGLGRLGPVGALLLTSALFAGVHLSNPEIRDFGSVFVLYYFSVGIFLGLITILDDGLELALGVHAVTNLYGTLLVTFPSSVLQTPALIEQTEYRPLLMSILATVASVVFVVVMWRRSGWSWASLAAGPVERAAVGVES